MPFKDMLKILQEKNKGKIVLVKLGAFYIATGKDTVWLSKKLDLKCTCFAKNICKVGVPIASLEKYVEKLDRAKLAYTIYDYDRQKTELKEVCTKIGKLNKEKRENINCLVCKGVGKYEDDIEYMINLIIKLPRTEKFSIGTDYKSSMYQMLRDVLYINKISRKENYRETLNLINKIDAELNCQRIYLRIMKKYKWIDTKKFDVVMKKIYESRGMHKACIDVQKAMRHCKNVWGDYYILKMDVRKYFDNIDKDILYKIISRKIMDVKLLKVLKQIIYSTKGKKGQPIGNYTSQTFANIYLNELDQYVKHKLKCKYYFRYMDDSIILLKTKKEAKRILEKIIKFLEIKLELELNSKTQIFKGKQGVNFCGYKINEYRMKLRDKGKRKLKKKVKKLTLQIKQGNLTSKEAKLYLCGHLGYIKYANVKNLTDKLFYKEN